MDVTENKIREILGRGVGETINSEHLARALKSGKKLRVKLGIDPTSPDLHLGHAVLLKKLRQFQSAGHKAVLIIGDFTARIGDPSGRDGARQPLMEKEIKKNMKKYLDLAGKIINVKDAHIYKNSTWLSGAEIPYTLASKISVQQVLEREDFQKRLKEGSNISMLEAFYPILQGYDSVACEADVEIGGNDQKFNLLMGRRVQRAFNMPEQDVLMMPLIEGTDGVRKMSKSYGNYIALDEKPNEMFSKIMSVPDEATRKYFLLLTDLSEDEAGDIAKKLPFEQKKILGEKIVSWFYGESSAKKAREYFGKIFSKKEMPENIKVCEVKAGEGWIDFLLFKGFALSRTEAKRLMAGGAIEFNGVKIEWAGEQITKNGVAKIGKHKFVKIKIT